MRRICDLELLSAKCVQSFQSLKEEKASIKFNLIHFLDHRIGHQANCFLSLTYGITSRVAFPKKSKDQEAFISVVNEANELVGGFRIADVFPSVELLDVISGMRPKFERLRQKSEQVEGYIQAYCLEFGVANIEISLTQLLYYFELKLPNNIKPEDLGMTEEKVTCT
ncbi:hypothetical protein HHK36_002245 [Tetracentron sinense]|uniref:Uncharacterized protein n=1 Tax=Tetracentron sinense TaxID=13715 RepID=A0A834ZUT3_TETSI|nr:hypothetical protein HHK36_002245 [Tetracentron sinense]